MSFLPVPILNQFKQEFNFRDSTIAIIDTNCKRVFREALNLSTYDPIQITNKESITSYLYSIENVGVRRTITSNIMNIIKIVDPSQVHHYQQLFDIFAKEHDLEYKGRMLDVDKFISLETLFQKYNQLPTNNFRAARDKVIAGFYCGIIPSLRGEDYYKTKWGHLPKDTDYKHFFEANGCNFLDLTNMVLIIGEYKTSNSHNLRLIAIPEILHETLNRWRQFNNSSSLLLDNKARPFLNSCQFTRKCSSFTGNGATVNTLRQIYISEITDYIDNLSQLSRKDKIGLQNELAHIMAHSYTSQQQIYAGYRDNSLIERSSSEFLHKSLNWLLETNSTVKYMQSLINCPRESLVSVETPKNE